MNSPCIDCEKKGCGSYHDECPEYNEYKEIIERNKIVYKPHGREFLPESTFRSRIKKR